jgi:hypothetical protein
MPCPSNFNQIYPDQAVAICTREKAEQLADFDHHRVLISGRDAVLLTYEWMPIEEHTGPFVLTAVFHHADRHPPAPQSVQAIVDGLKFQVRGQAR